MNIKFFCYLFISITFFSSFCLGAPTSRSSVNDDQKAILRQMRVDVSDLRHEMNNHESEIRMFEEKLRNQEEIIENLRQELLAHSQMQKELLKTTNTSFENKIEFLDHTMQNLISDMRQMKNQANDSVNILGQHKQQLTELEKVIEAQNQHMQNLEVALSSIVDVLQAKEATEKAFVKEAETNKIYKVQAGNTLGEIARHYGISIQSLKDYNGLTHDRIKAGQILKIP